MSEAEEPEKIKESSPADVIANTDVNDFEQLESMLNNMRPGEIARLLESLPQHQREFVWDMVDDEYNGEILVELGDEVRASLINQMDTEALMAATLTLNVDDLADLVQDLPKAINQAILDAMDDQDRKRLEAVLVYDEDTAGGLMDTDFITVRAHVTLDVILRYLRRHTELPSSTDSLMVVNRDDRYLGILSLANLVINDPDLTVAEVMDQRDDGINALTEANDVAKIFQDRDLISAAVVDDDGKLLGRITIDDVVDHIREEAEHTVNSMAGLREEEDLFAPVFRSMRGRSIWLGVNLITAFLASWVISLFAGTLEQIVALAVLMPIVASMGGIAGSQTLTLVIRGIALKQVSKSNRIWLLRKEIAVGLLNGLLWAVVVATVATLWFDDINLGYVIAFALILNLFFAAGSGVAIPVLLKKLNIDPALAGGVVLTTVTDVVGFMAFLGLGSLFLL